MSKIQANLLATAFEEIIGWPYVSPGTNNQLGIDCSGAFVRAYKKHGLSIAHGSNTIFRKHCDVTGRIEGDVSRLHVGMAVFKQSNDGGEPAKYHGDGFGNMYHIGLVTSVNPLRIVHATTPVAKVDTTIGAWEWYGWLDAADYEGSTQSTQLEPEVHAGAVESEPESYAPVNVQAYVKVVTPDGNPVKVREKHDTNIYKYKAPAGTVMLKTGTKGKYFKIMYQGKERLVDQNFVVACDAQGNVG